MEFRILGPLEVVGQHGELVLGGGRQRSLLVLLLLHANDVVSSDRLIEELWSGAPPPTAAKTVQVYVSQLRKVLRDSDGACPLLTRGHGYVLCVEPGELDLERFERALADGRRALQRGAPDAAGQLLRDALALWRGTPLSDVSYEPFAQAEIARLEALRLAAIEERVEADLALGRHAEVVVELDGLVAAHPLRERLRGQLMLALYRSDRQADALAVFREGRTLLDEDLGLEPGPALRQLETAILAHDPAIAAPRRAPPPRREAEAEAARRGPRALVVAGAVLVAGAVGGAALIIAGRDPPARAAGPVSFSAVAALAPDGRTLAAVPLPGVSTLAVGGGLVWVGDEDSRTVSAIDARTRRIVRTVATGLFPTALAADAGSVWVFDDARRRLARIDARYGGVRGRLRLERRPTTSSDRFEHDPASVAVGGGAVWITDGTSRLVRVDAKRTVETGSVDTGRRLNGVAADARAVWAISGQRAEVLRIDPRALRVTARVQVVDQPGLSSPVPVSIAVGGDHVWVLNRNTATVTKIDAQARGVVGSIPVDVDRAPVDIAADRRGAWIANGDGTVTQIDAETDRVEVFAVGNTLRDVAVGAGAVWASNRLTDCCEAGSSPRAESPAGGERPPRALTGCSRVHYGGPGRPDVLIASDLPLHGTYANDGVQGSQAIRLVLEDHGFRAGARTVGYVSCDAATPQAAERRRCARSARAYVSARAVVGLVGPFSSSCARHQLAILNRAPVAAVAPGTTYVGLTRGGAGIPRSEPARYRPGKRRSFVRLAAPDDLQGRAHAALARRAGVTRAFVLHDGSDAYTLGVAAAFRDAASSAGIEIAGFDRWAPEASGYAALAGRVKRSGADAVFLSGYITSNIGPLIRGLRARLGAGARLMAPDAMLQLPTLLAEAGDASEGMILSVPALANERLGPAGRQFRERFRRRTGQDPCCLTVHVAQAAAVLLDAIAASDGSRSSVAAALLRARVRGGIIGSFAFDPDGDIDPAIVSMYRIRGGEQQLVDVVRTASRG
jgi:DNA-binding SARP family transcriptional activator/ABC-type branched-subunit amino acid transport system substrate-binding protein/DNA-binding beta-propeller fold protein YncE